MGFGWDLSYQVWDDVMPWHLGAISLAWQIRMVHLYLGVFRNVTWWSVGENLEKHLDLQLWFTKYMKKSFFLNLIKKYLRKNVGKQFYKIVARIYLETCHLLTS